METESSSVRCKVCGGGKWNWKRRTRSNKQALIITKKDERSTEKEVVRVTGRCRWKDEKSTSLYFVFKNCSGVSYLCKLWSRARVCRTFSLQTNWWKNFVSNLLATFLLFLIFTFYRVVFRLGESQLSDDKEEAGNILLRGVSVSVENAAEHFRAARVARDGSPQALRALRMNLTP